MKIFLDADGCPVVRLAVQIARRHGVECVILCDTAHEFAIDGAQTITVDKGADSVDFKLVSLVHFGDLVVTQDYGLAAMCLAKGAVPINQDGMVYTSANIDALLMARHTAKKIRNAGGRLKGPTKRTAAQNDAFAQRLEALMQAN